MVSGVFYTWKQKPMRLAWKYIELDNADFPEQSWLQLIYCTVCLLHDCNFRRLEQNMKEIEY